jgi:hypothetical protein
MNVYDTARVLREHWDSFTTPVVDIYDAARFDQHISLEMLEFEHGFYTPLFQNDPELVMLLRWQLRNKGFARCNEGNVKFDVRGVRGSGDMNTACGNVIIMTTLMVSYYRSRKIPFKILDAGDDCVLTRDKSTPVDYADIQDYFRKKGFKLKHESYHTEFEDIEFCRGKPIFDGENWIMCRIPDKTLDKDFLSIRPLEAETPFRNHCQSLYSCGASIAGHLPIYWKYYQCFNIGGKVNRDHQGLRYAAERLSPNIKEPTWHARLGFYIAFNITPDEQVALENYYSTIRLRWHDRPLGIEKLEHYRGIT